MNFLRELALQRTHRATRGGFRRSIDQIDNGFSLRKIELAVEKRTSRELAGFGKPRAEVQAAREQHLQDDHAAVPL